MLATLVRVEGSSYRRPGARMYIHATGSLARLAADAWKVKSRAKPRGSLGTAPRSNAIPRCSTKFWTRPTRLTLAKFPTDSAVAASWTYCWSRLHRRKRVQCCGPCEAADRGETLYAATVLPSAADQNSGFARVILRDDNTIFFASSDLMPRVLSRLKSLASAGGDANTVCIPLENEPRDVFVETIAPPQRLVLFGAGDDARPLVRMANLLGWRVTVADGRAWLAKPARFPEAERVLTLSESAANFEQLALTHRDAVALLTHSFEQDRNLLGKLLPIELRYLGLLGARHRSRLLLTEAAAQLGWSPEEALQRVHAPIGLDLGGDSPEAVALAILAEIQSVVQQKNAISRGMSTEDFLAVPERSYIPVQCSLDSPRDRESSDPIHAVETTR